MNSIFSDGRVASLTVNGSKLGIIGEVNGATCERYDIPKAVYVAEIDFDLLTHTAKLDRTFRKLPTYPGAIRDLAILVDETVSWKEIESAIQQLSIPILEKIEFFDLFKGKQVPPGKKSVAFSLTFRAPDRTLTSDEVETARQAAIQALSAIGATLRT